jgi:hypothetical protein
VLDISVAVALFDIDGVAVMPSTAIAIPDLQQALVPLSR